MKSILKKRKGITLIALVVTIVVLLILAGISISMLTGENGILTNTSSAKIQTELANYKEQVDLYKTQKVMENIEFNEQSLTVGKDSLNYNTKPDGERGNIKTIIPDLKDEYISNLQIIKGSLSIKTKDKKIIKIAQSVGIEVNPYDITDDGELISSNGNLLLVDNNGTLTLPDTVKKIGYGAFSGVSGLKKIIIPSSVIEIEPYAFSNNTTLESVEIQGDLEKIGENAFDDATNLKEINLPDSINDIGKRAFRRTSLSEVVIPKNLSSVQLDVFSECKLMKKITLQEGVEEILEDAFRSNAFNNIKLPSTLKNINGRAFSYCDNLIDIDVSENPNFTYTSGILMNQNEKSMAFISSAKLKNITEFEIPEGIKSFNNNIYNFSNITKLIIPSSLEDIYVGFLPTSIADVEIKEGNQKLIAQNGILYNTNNDMIMCYSKDKDITIPDGIENIKTYSFTQAENVENITFPDSVKKIEIRIILTSTKIKNINIGKNVTYINPLFKNQNYSGNVNIDKDNPVYEVKDNILYQKVDGKKDILVRVLYNIQNNNITIDSEVKKLGDYAFYAQSGLTQISIPSGVTTLGRAFNYCPYLTKVEIPNTVTSIEKNCFADSTNNLTEIIVNNKENSISGAPWGAVKGLKVVTWKN